MAPLFQPPDLPAAVFNGGGAYRARRARGGGLSRRLPRAPHPAARGARADGLPLFRDGSGFCLLWGVYYYGTDFEAASGVSGALSSAAQLETVTRWFTDLANEYGEQVQRDENGEFAEDLTPIFARSAALYDAVEEVFPCLAGDDIAAKPF